MEKNLLNQIWPEDSSKWFMSELDSSVPHNFDNTNIEANSTIKQYLLDRGLVILPGWMPDKIFHAHFKRWVGNCSVPYDTLQESTSVNSLYLSFFPFIFEVTSAIFLEEFNSFVTRPHFLDFGDTLLISQEKPHVVRKNFKELLDHLLGLQDPKYGFIYLVLINDENQSNIDAMGFEESGQFWVRLKIGLNHLSIKNINSDHARVNSDRARQIQILKTDLASADFYIQLDVENRNGFTYLLFKKKTSEEPNSQESSIINSGKKKKAINDKETTQENGNRKEDNDKPEPDNKQASINHGPNIYGGTFTNVVMGDNAKQINYPKSDDE